MESSSNESGVMVGYSSASSSFSSAESSIADALGKISISPDPVAVGADQGKAASSTTSSAVEEVRPTAASGADSKQVSFTISDKLLPGFGRSTVDRSTGATKCDYSHNPGSSRLCTSGGNPRGG